MSVWLVIFGNYDPAEVDSIWRTEDGARARARELGGMWTVQEWEVQG